MDVRKALLAPLALVLLAGCSGDGSAAPAPATLPPLQSASPTATAVALPPEATPDTAQGAAAFARFYLASLDQSFTERNPAAISELSTASCGTCNNFIVSVKSLAEQDLTREGGDLQVLQAEASQTGTGEALVDVFYKQAASTTKAAGGATVRAAEGRERGFLQMQLTRAEGGTWRVAGITFPQVPS